MIRPVIHPVIRTATAVMIAALLAAPIAAPITARAAPKPAAKAPAPAAQPAKPAAAKPPAQPAFDARDPMGLIALLSTAGAKANVSSKEGDTVLISVTSNAANFSAQFVGCDAQGRACKAVLFDNQTDQAGPTFAQMNAFNQTSAMCRGYEDKTGKPHVLYSTLVFAEDGRDRMRTQVEAWTGCIGEFRNFLKDPNGYLASAP